MKIALMTIFQVPNYGSVLQAYATQYFLETLGHECSIINYKYPNEWHVSRGAIPKKFNIKEYFGKLFGLTSYYRRWSKLNRFRKHRLHLTKQYLNFEELSVGCWDAYDFVVLGSDQVLNVRFQRGDPAFLLSFLPSRIRRISFSSSFANQLPPEFNEEFKYALSLFSSLSVREVRGKEIIHNQLGITKDVAVLLDPTLLLDKNDWGNLILNKKNRQKPYILLYLLTYAFTPFPYVFDVISEFKERIGDCDIVVLEGYNQVIKGCKCKVVQSEDCDISQYLQLFKNAELVITTSFHGSAFAVNFGKPLISIIPDDNHDDRQVSLLSSLGLSNCIVKIGSNVKEIFPFYDVVSEQDNLDRLRMQSKRWLLEALEK